MATTRVLVSNLRTLTVRSQSRLLLPSIPIVNQRYSNARGLPLAFTPRRLVTTAPTPPNPNAAPSSSATGVPPSPAVPPTEDDARHASFLGEADSDDGFNAAQEINPSPQPALDATNAAFLGEADSDDGFEAENERDPRPEVPLDAGQSAFLGEADSDDGFEGTRLVRPIGEDHGIEDASVSGSHGEPGEGDQ